MIEEQGRSLPLVTGLISLAFTLAANVSAIVCSGPLLERQGIEAMYFGRSTLTGKARQAAFSASVKFLFEVHSVPPNGT